MRRLRVAVFDLGGVLIHWDPRRLYRKMFESEAEVPNSTRGDEKGTI